MSQSGILRFDKYLTNLSQMYQVGSLIGKKVAPLVSADMSSDKIFVDSEDYIDQKNDEAEATSSGEVDHSVGTPYTYRTTRKALHSVLLDKQKRNQATIVKGEIRETNKLTHRLELKHESRVSTILTDPLKVTQTVDIDDTANARWDESSPDLEGDLVKAVKAIYDATGASANTFIIPFNAALYAATIGFITDTLKYQHGMSIVSAQFQQQVRELVGLPPVIKGLNVLIADARINTANKGQTKSVSNPWGVDALVGYVPPSPGIDSSFGILTMEYDSRKVRKGRVSDPEGTKILTEWDYDVLEADLGHWYLMQNVIDPT